LSVYAFLGLFAQLILFNILVLIIIKTTLIETWINTNST